MDATKRGGTWWRRLGQAAMIAGVVVGLGATPGCMCRSRGYVPGGRVYVRPMVRTRPYVRPVVRTRPVVRVGGPSVRVGAPVARPAPARRP
jgi:hypothetical protein